MENSNKKIKIYLILLLLEFFILISLFFLNPDMVNQKNYILFCLSFLLAIGALSIKLVTVIFASLFIVFVYGSFILYKAIFEGNFNFTFTHDYFWLLVFPIIAYTSGHLGDSINNASKTVQDLKQKVKTLVKVDDLTGLNNKQKFYEDLYDEMRRAKRHDFDLAVMMVKVMFYNELISIYGTSKTNDVIRIMVKNIEETLRVEDKKYRLERDTFIFILPNTDINGAEVIKNRLRKNLDQITLTTGQKQEKLNFNFKIGILPYDKKLDDVLVFKQKLEKELEYDV